MARSAQPKTQLQQERLRRNWRQRDVADKLGTSVVTVNRWEKGLQQPGAYFRLKLCALFGKSAEELGLLDGRSSPPPITPQGDAVEVTHTDSSPSDERGLWTVPYPRNPHFTGRDETLDRLDQHLSAPGTSEQTPTRRVALTQPQAIKGLGGIGKTQIAVEYAYRAAEQGRYVHTFWINAASQEAIITSFAGLAEQLPDFPAREETDQHKLVAAIKRWLEQCPERWLLIFDNADDVSLAQEYFPQQGHGSILLTTRANAIAAVAASIDVEQMGIMEGTQFLLHRAQRLDAADDERNEAINVVIALDGFPLALDQAGAYIEETGCSFVDYLQLYYTHRRELLARRGVQATRYPDSVATTWFLSFQRVEQVSPAVAELLRLCAFLAPDRIPEELFKEGAAYWPPALQQAVSDLFTFNQMLEALLRFSLVKRLTADRLLGIHRLVQAVIVDTMEPEEQRQWAERVVRAINAVFSDAPKDAVETWPRCLRHLEQAQACDTLIQQHLLCLREAAELLERTGRYLYEHASYTIAEPLYLRALRILEQTLGPDHLQIASLLDNMGDLYRQQGKFAEIEPLCLRALHMREQSLGPDHPSVATSLYRLAILSIDQGKYEQAEPLLQQALSIQEQSLGPDHPAVATSLYRLADMYWRQKKYEQVECFLLRALRIGKQTLGPDHLDMAGPSEALGFLYSEQGKYEQAAPLLRQALRIREHILGPEHPDMATSLNNLATFYLHQKQYEQAEPLFQRALHIWEQALGPEHLYLAYPLAGLASLYGQQRKDEQAEPLFRRALHIWEQIQEHHPEMHDALYDFALLREAQGNMQEAASLYQRALVIREHTLGAVHPQTIDTREHLRVVQLSLEQTEVGEPH